MYFNNFIYSIFQFNYRLQTHNGTLYQQQYFLHQSPHENQPIEWKTAPQCRSDSFFLLAHFSLKTPLVILPNPQQHGQYLTQTMTSPSKKSDSQSMKYCSDLSNQSNVLYVSNFPRSIKKKQLEEVFSKFGHLAGLDIYNYSSIPIPYCFVEFDDLRDAVEAKKQLDHSLLFGSMVNVQYRKTKGQKPLFNLSHNSQQPDKNAATSPFDHDSLHRNQPADSSKQISSETKYQKQIPKDSKRVSVENFQHQRKPNEQILLEKVQSSNMNKNMDDFINNEINDNNGGSLHPEQRNSPIIKVVFDNQRKIVDQYSKKPSINIKKQYRRYDFSPSSSFSSSSSSRMEGGRKGKSKLRREKSERRKINPNRRQVSRDSKHRDGSYSRSREKYYSDSCSEDKRKKGDRKRSNRNHSLNLSCKGYMQSVIQILNQLINSHDDKLKMLEREVIDLKGSKK